MRHVGWKRVAQPVQAADSGVRGDRSNSTSPITAEQDDSIGYQHLPRSILPVLVLASAMVHSVAIRADGTEWCRTVSPGATESINANGECPTHGICDEPSARNAAIPDEGEPIVTIRLKLNVFREDDGTNPVVTAELLAAQVAQLQADFLPYHIQFTTTAEFINDSASRNFELANEADMKHAHADQPGKQLNVYIVDFKVVIISLASFPWNSPLSDLGGIIIDNDFVELYQHVLSHEVGHILGLWHTDHGVDEVADCSVCYELADGSNGDTSGDFCSDTASSPFNPSCLPPDATDCKGVAFPLVTPVNVMGKYIECFESFTAQQAGRMHCWIADALSSWVTEAMEPGDPDVPTISKWGIAVQVLALLTVASVVLIRRQQARH